MKESPVGRTTIKIIKDAHGTNLRQFFFQKNFITNTISPADLEKIKENEIDLYIETECVDERVLAQTTIIGQIRLAYNCPGGGFDYLSKADIRNLLTISDGHVILDPHRHCGWGNLRMNFYENYSKQINKPLPDTTMFFPKDIEFQDGIDYIKFLIGNSFSNSNFVNSILRSDLSSKYKKRKDFDQAILEAFSKKGVIYRKDTEHKDLLEIAFNFGKQNELKWILQDEAIKLGMNCVFIKLNPDMLFDQPQHHYASDAVINLTSRKLIERSPLATDSRNPFFAVSDLERLISMMELIISILESDHSLTQNHTHNFYIVCNKEQLNQVEMKLERYRRELEIYDCNTNFIINIINENASSKSIEELLSLVN